MARSKTAKAEIDRWLKEEPRLRYRKIDGGFDISNGAPLDLYACAFLCRNSKGRWSATHNMKPDDDDPLYRHMTPQEAWENYQERRR